MKTIFLLLISVSAFSQTAIFPDITENSKIVVTRFFKGIVAPNQDFKVGQNKYWTIILKLPDSTKEYNVKVIATEVTTQPLPDKVTRIDDTDPRIVYSGTWFKQASTGSIVWPDLFLNKNVSYTTTANAYSELKFTGTGIEVISELRENHATASVFIDNVKVADVDMYKATQANDPSVIFSKKDLVKGEHTIRVQLAGVTASRNSMVSDGFTILEKQP